MTRHCMRMRPTGKGSYIDVTVHDGGSLTSIVDIPSQPGEGGRELNIR